MKEEREMKESGKNSEKERRREGRGKE
jgi:hypothetical protein